MSSTWNTLHPAGVSGYDSQGRLVTVGGHFQSVTAANASNEATRANGPGRTGDVHDGALNRGGMPGGGAIGDGTVLADSSQTLLRLNPGWQTLINSGALLLVSG